MVIKESNDSNDILVKENVYNTSKSLTSKHLVIKSKNKLGLLEPNKYMPLSKYSYSSDKEKLNKKLILPSITIKPSFFKIKTKENV